MQTQRQGIWLQTYTGIPFYPLDPRPEDINIEDIAHALSNICRYGGHCLRFYCPVETERVLTADLKWIPAGDLKLGTELVGFDEKLVSLGSTGHRRRKFRPSIVTNILPIKRNTILLEMADGSTVTASDEHPWLVATKQSKNQTWKTTQQILNDVSAGRKRYMHKFIAPWKQLDTYDAGWLAGMLDGEGYLSILNRKGFQAGIAQKPGATLEKLKFILHKYNIDFWESITGTSGTISLQIKGGWRSVLQLIGSVSAGRLIKKYRDTLFSGEADKQLDGQGAPLEIIKAKKLGKKWVTGIETSTHTYLCEGFGAHNSVAQHSVLVSQLVPEGMEMWGLLHDASEAYLMDIPRPVKEYLPDYHKIEAICMEAVAKQFNLSMPIPEEIKLVDNAALKIERKLLMESTECCVWFIDDLYIDISWYNGNYMDIHITPQKPSRAEQVFLERYEQILGME